MNSAHLFDDNSEYWLIVDAVRMADIMPDVYTMWPEVESEPLFLESDFVHLMAQSPIIFKFGNNANYVEKWISSPELHSSSIVIGMRRGLEKNVLLLHLRKLLTVSIDGKLVFFRYYTSKFWEEFEAQLLAADKDKIIAPASSIYWIQYPQTQPQVAKVSTPSTSSINDVYYTLSSNVFSKWV
ncbi:DUF4123 domain-containing protein [Enterovibrio norvegicus]|uniref:DUF4123 domain-containing protein n=1 Tax=Enterovibrio norvegicus DSM 15893 TaxID=1121869 RepID=A0A1I5XVI8_9GAMM|nr:DUF4123 domain-containing protein [Enterovibrio norvegicus]SFQ35969.1 protein of unknown function [Enterovibrio norvegicus DSM 15893]